MRLAISNCQMWHGSPNWHAKTGTEPDAPRNAMRAMPQVLHRGMQTVAALLLLMLTPAGCAAEVGDSEVAVRSEALNGARDFSIGLTMVKYTNNQVIKGPTATTPPFSADHTLTRPRESRS